ncbi:MAG: 2-amino-4-hydroxy-6-hydroxymethyldihydropteridine diphosphokinase [Acidimicrobiales bacterium]|nr:2-amino-4-hydroxy-6-hydroxymethyldihydropteridine diphosphokinase [Acidimicrobiales bacterium]
MGSIFVNRIELEGVHGVLQSEKLGSQPFCVDVELSGDLNRAGQSDNLGDTLDYEIVINKVREIILGEPINLLEALAYRIATSINEELRDSNLPIYMTKVRVEKVKPPVADVGSVSAVQELGVSRSTYIGLGSNLGIREHFIKGAIERLPGFQRLSPIYETEPVGGPKDQEKYLNAVAELDFDGSPEEMLRICQGIETWANRVREEKNGPRTLDLDILLIGKLEVNSDLLVVPHPRMWERNFVLAPLGDLRPDLISGQKSKMARGSVRKLDNMIL